MYNKYYFQILTIWSFYQLQMPRKK